MCCRSMALETYHLPLLPTFLRSMERFRLLKCGTGPNTSLQSIDWFLTHNTIAGLRTLPDAIQCFTSLRILRIQNCHNLKTLPEWLGNLTSLREIFIESCPRLPSLPESIIKRLTELRRLEITNCPTLIEKCRGDTCTRSLIFPYGEILLATFIFYSQSFFSTQ